MPLFRFCPRPGNGAPGRRIGAILALLPIIACSDGQGPNLQGPPFFKIAVDGDTVAISAVQAGCGDSGLIISASTLTAKVPDADVLELRVHDVERAATYPLADPPSGRFAHTYFLGPAGISYATGTAAPGSLVLTGLDFSDSTIAGRFTFRLVSLVNPSTGYDVAGSFRLPLGMIYTVQNPQGTPCQAP